MTISIGFRRLLRSLRRNGKGSILIETALVIPVIMVLITGGFEVTRFALLYQKVNRIAVSMADLVSQAKTINETDISGLFDAVVHIGEPFDVTNNGEVIISSIGLKNGVPTVNWQRSGGGHYSGTSHVGTEGGNATLPSGFVLHAGDTVIIAEAFYNYHPALFTDIMKPTVLYNIAYYRPRLGTLDQVQPG
ncbi:MAG TPA: TadE/TadG family type IV pilus assembly protein [Alphaproteobacteria bacterium]|nr:TadE/TadG family type IV pilus assembly protein [Alphaproteobacteria bacterium]